VNLYLNPTKDDSTGISPQSLAKEMRGLLGGKRVCPYVNAFQNIIQPYNYGVQTDRMFYE